MVWDGTNETGFKVSSGVYIVQMKSEGFTALKKMLLIK